MLNKVEICGISTASLPKVKQQEVEKMLRRIKNGEECLKEEFIRSNLRLVLSVVQKFNNKKENLDDIFQIGCTTFPYSISFCRGIYAHKYHFGFSNTFFYVGRKEEITSTSFFNNF